MLGSLINDYNNPALSDVKIKLKSGEFIYAHRLILSKSSDMLHRMVATQWLKNGEIAFPDNPDVCVIATIKHIYGVSLNIASSDDWFNLIDFAYFVNIPSLISVLCENIPQNTSVNQLIAKAHIYDNNSIMTHVVDNVATTKNTIIDHLDISYDAYLYFRNVWIKRCHSEFDLLKIDCEYCTAIASISVSDDDTIDTLHAYMNQLIPTLDFSTFSKEELETSSKLPIIKMIPMLSHLLKMMPVTRSFGDLFGQKERTVYTPFRKQATGFMT